MNEQETQRKRLQQLAGSKRKAQRLERRNDEVEAHLMNDNMEWDKRLNRAIHMPMDDRQREIMSLWIGRERIRLQRTANLSDEYRAGFCTALELLTELVFS